MWIYSNTILFTGLVHGEKWRLLSLWTPGVTTWVLYLRAELSWSSQPFYFPSAIQRVPLMYSVHFMLCPRHWYLIFKIYRHVLQTAILYLKLFLAQCTTFCCSMDFCKLFTLQIPFKTVSVVFGFPLPPLYAELVCFILSEN